MTLAQFFLNKKTELPKVSQEEIMRFYLMLIQMKNHRPNLNVIRIMKKLYPNFKLDNKIAFKQNDHCEFQRCPLD